MAIINPDGSNKYWYDGSVVSVIDNGIVKTTGVTTNNWAGSTNFWYQGTPQGYLQGGPGTISESPQNISLSETEGFLRQPIARTGRAYAIIL